MLMKLGFGKWVLNKIYVAEQVQLVFSLDGASRLELCLPKQTPIFISNHGRYPW